MKLLTETFGETIASQIVSPSRSVDQHPLLVSIAMRNGQYTILNLLDSQIQELDDMRLALDVIRHHFDCPDTAPVKTPNNEWPMTTNPFFCISPQQSEFKRIANCLNLEKQKIILMQNVRNFSRSTQSSTDEMARNDSEGSTSNEEELFYGCPPAIARDILQHGFNLDIHCIHGKLFHDLDRQFCDYSR